MLLSVAEQPSVHSHIMCTPLSAISNILTSGIANIESAYVQRGVPFPSLDEPFQPSEFDDGDLMETTNLVLAAAAQLIAMLKPPHQTLGEGGMAVSNPIPLILDAYWFLSLALYDRKFRRSYCCKYSRDTTWRWTKCAFKFNDSSIYFRQTYYLL